MKVGDTWTCHVCGAKIKMTDEGVRHVRRGHSIHESLEYEDYSVRGVKNKKSSQTELF